MNKTLLIIGNGFDLNLGLKTGYCDFIKSDYFKKEVNNNNQLCKYLLNQQELYNWIDIENELKKYSTETDSQPKQVKQDFKNLSASLIDYLSSLPYDKINKESIAYQIINDLCKMDIVIIDFNYTPTTKILYPEKKIIKVHGSIENKDIIFGVEDMADIKKEHIFLKKSYNINFTPIDISNYLEISDSIIFFGHSLGETDHTYFKDFFFFPGKSYNTPLKEVYISYHGNDSYDNIMMQIDTMSNQNLYEFKKSYNVRFINTVNEKYDHL
ncbi:AbiH family protein [Parabacteroides goldsteinii]|jgi:hypothetical protein|uniref:Bacteriophage abortive infection AbiH n=2 Tax=Parabacteroides goldsteinii TaxID=328812 RepID=A0A0J6CI49_9BACT|nr:AbiH family protein [Parabacteroides goldsteinii]KKB59957.1 hypothetical protein HMPREF1535_00230 [Parabacteroides goldsteinii DSM 19448 = WAL 12034]KMM32865.1 hypothetical protein ACM15_15270 [Parabacteroides goldsteinii]